MWSFFKSKKQPEAKGSNDDISGAELYLRVARLKSVKLEFFHGLLALTDEITERIEQEYRDFGAYNRLEVGAFCASMITTGIITTDLSEQESSEVIDIYLSLWADVASKNYPGTSATALKTRMTGLWLEYTRMMLRAYGESPEQIMMDDGSVARNLVRNVDRLAGIQRDEVKQAVTAVTFKVTISESIRIVATLVEQSRAA